MHWRSASIQMFLLSPFHHLNRVRMVSEMLIKKVSETITFSHIEILHQLFCSVNKCCDKSEVKLLPIKENMNFKLLLGNSLL